MNTTDDAATWRDLADQLTPDHIAYLEYWESHPELPPTSAGRARTPEEHARTLLFSARESIKRNAEELERL